MERRRQHLRLLLLVGAAAAALALILLLRCDRSAAPERKKTAAKPQPARVVPTPGGPPPQPAELPAIDGEPLAPIIDEVIVEKPEVCRGEENLITVRAHTPDGAEDEFLHYFVSSDPGASVPLRLHDRSDEARGEVQREVIVFGRNNVATKVPLPPFTIKDCEPERKLIIQRRLLANTESEFEFTARITDVAAAEPMRPVSYRWSFGDGGGVETTEPVATWDYANRAQDAQFSHLLVSCTAVAADGEQVMGRLGLQLLNPAFEELAYKGLVRLTTLLNPRFPELGDDGMVRQEVRVWHHRPDVVQIHRVNVVHNYLPDDRGAVRQPWSEQIDPMKALGFREVPPGGGVAATMELDPRAEPTLLSRDYFLEGTSAEGLPAHGNFSIMRPPPAPTRTASQPVVSEYMKAKILRARELLGKEFVTDEDIWMLERRGALADIRPEDYPPDPLPPEPVRPPAGKPILGGRPPNTEPR